MFAGTYVAQQILNGVVLGSMYALLALGMTVVYGILHLINFAHGALVTAGAFTFFGIYMVLGWPFSLALAATLLVGGVLGYLLDLVGYRKLRGGPEVALLITSLGIYILLENLIKLLATPQPYAFRPPAFLGQLQNVGGVTFRTVDVFIVVVSVLIMIAFALFVKRTKLGIAMRATAESVEAAKLVGINVNQVVAVAFVLGGFLGVMGAFLIEAVEKATEEMGKAVADLEKSLSSKLPLGIRRQFSPPGGGMQVHRHLGWSFSS